MDQVTQQVNQVTQQVSELMSKWIGWGMFWCCC
jgi:hypothetical protein